MQKIYLLIIGFVLCGTLSGQTLDSDTDERWIIGLGTTVNSHSFKQGDNDIYKEITIDYGFSQFFRAGIYIGHQKRNYLFPSVTNSGLKFYTYNQNFIPIGLRGTFNLTTFVNENLIKGHLNPKRWEIYVTYFGGLILNNIQDNFDRNYQNWPERIDYTFYQTDEDISYNMGILTGVTYYPVKKFGLFVEFGLGTMGNLNMGIKSRF